MARRSVSVPYRVGDWFVVPLADGTFAPGRVVVHQPPQSTLCYLFAPVVQRPTSQDVEGLRPGDALLAAVMSGLALGERWELLGGGDGFERDAWPMPEFESEPDDGTVRVSVRDERLRVVATSVVPASQAGRRQPDGAMGSGYVEAWFPRQVQAGALVPLRTQPWWTAG